MRVQRGDNLALTDFSLAPIYLFKISGPLTLIKLRPHSLATAEASMVFPHPGYPYSNSLSRHQNKCDQEGLTYPERRRRGDCAKMRAYFVGHSSVSRRTLFVSFSPVISHETGLDFHPNFWKQTPDICPADCRFLEIHIPERERDKIFLSRGEISIGQFRLSKKLSTRHANEGFLLTPTAS